MPPSTHGNSKGDASDPQSTQQCPAFSPMPLVWQERSTGVRQLRPLCAPGLGQGGIYPSTDTWTHGPEETYLVVCCCIFALKPSPARMTEALWGRRDRPLKSRQQLCSCLQHRAQRPRPRIQVLPWRLRWYLKDAARF